MPSVTPSGALCHRLLRLALRLTMAALVLIALLYCGLRIYAGYLAHRAVSLLAEADCIQVGATEDSILPLVARYGAFKWKPESPIPTDGCPDKARCEYYNAHRSDYAYGIALAPFNVMSAPYPQTGHLRRTIAALMIQTPSSWRDPLSLRDWEIEVEIYIRSGRVEKVLGSIFVEGRTRWLGNTWVLSADTHDQEIGPRAYKIIGTALTFPGNGGGGILQYLTPAATAEQLLAAHSFDARCLTGVVPCRHLCDLTPRAFQYLNQHPEFGNIVASDDCLGPQKP